MPRHPRTSDFWYISAIALLILGFSLPFLDHAFHIDEPLFLRVAEQIKRDPWHPFDFFYLWDTEYLPMSRIAAFSPLFSYYLAATSLGEIFPSEFRIHLALIPFAWIAAFSFYSVTRRLGFSAGQSMVGTCLWVCSPAFVVSSQLAMPDMAMCAFALLALSACIKGWISGKNHWLIAGGIFLGITCLLRYNAAPLFLIYFLLGLTFSTWRRAVAPTALALVITLIWLAASKWQSGQSHAQEVMSTFASWKGAGGRLWALMNQWTLATLLPFFILFTKFPKKAILGLLAIFIGLDLSLWLSKPNQVFQFRFFPDLALFVLGLLAILGIAASLPGLMRSNHLFGFTVSTDAGRVKWSLSMLHPSQFQGNADLRSVVLFLWVISILAIPLIYVHNAAKYLLIAQPPFILLLLNYWNRSQFHSRKWILAALPLMLAVSLGVAWADFGLANLYKEQAFRFYKEFVHPIQNKPATTKNQVWFTGHWGWQYYLENWGALALPTSVKSLPTLRGGDLVLQPTYNSVNQPPAELGSRLKELERYEIDWNWPFRTMNYAARAGFYSNNWGPLPYSLSRAPLETFTVYRFRNPRASSQVNPHTPHLID